MKNKYTMFGLLMLGITCGTLFAPLYKTGITMGINLTPENTLFYRMLLATAIVGAWCLSRPEQRQELLAVFRDRKTFFILAVLGLLRGLDLLMWAYALTGTSVFVANILGNTSPVFIIIGSYLVYRERTSLRAVAGVIISLVGVSIVGISEGGAGGTVTVGTVLLMTASSLSYAVFLLISRAVRDKMNAMTMMFFVFAWCTPMSLVACLVSGSVMGPIPAVGWALLLGMVVFGMLFSQVLPIFTIKYLNPLHVSVVSLTAPFISAVTAYIFLGERLSGTVLLGGLVMFAGLAVYTLSDYFESRKKNLV